MKKLLVPYKVALLAVAVIYNCIAYWGSRLFEQGRVHHYLGFAFENHIPLLTWSIYIYWGCYVFWVLNYCLIVAESREATYRLVIAEILSKTVCFLFYVLLPTTMPRPEITAAGLDGTLMRLLYQIDPADNLLPSIHCLMSWICFVGVRGKERIPLWYRVLSCVIALMICISTLTTKQHVLVDVFAGILLAEAAYAAAGILAKRLVKKRMAWKKRTG